jgi:hypothetical protein
VVVVQAETELLVVVVQAASYTTVLNLQMQDLVFQ